ncbi:AMP-binding enzyme [Pleurostoma richardsiae]|uniref:AMP-binding enzyme n=1 Tax=Pleurostoma richardsiae TaxID=41990 RepID=A0AA38RZP2_9PEZI|nr:AMP-binding enzyme [Pleurostoma richardsiae]
MSPVATSGSATVLDNGAPGWGGFSFGGGRGAKRVLPHIDDIIHVAADVDVNTPIEKVLTAAESSMRSAESSKSFNRPDLALKEYLKSYHIVAEVIPRHPDFVSFQADRKPLGDRFAALIKKINSQHGAFERIKQDIKADNARTGVQPVSSHPPSTTQASGSRPGTASSTASNHGGYRDGEVSRGHTPMNGHAIEGPSQEGSGPRHSQSPSQQPLNSSPRVKPVVHPKPHALHGNAIKPGGGQGASAKNKAGEDLLARFANLRATPSQDPRIRTQPLAPRPMGPREMPQKPTVSLHGTLPDMPKMPDAIYSPARGTVSNEAAELPSSTPRGIFSRTNSTASFTNSSSVNAFKSQPQDDYFTPSHSFGPASSLQPQQRRISIPEGDSVTVEELIKLQQAGAKDVQVLLIDVRRREDFDDGHIMSQSTICIEPEILQRTNISANEIADSMILSPQRERLLFEGRHDFDVIVFYDESSEKMDWSRSGGSNDTALLNLFNALKYYDFYGDSENKSPKLLEGGLRAWTSVLGVSALQSSKTLIGVSRIQKPMRNRASSVYGRPLLPKSATKPIQDADEARRWEETLPAMTAEYHRTKDDFLRRFPDITPEKESMISPIAPIRSEPRVPHFPAPRTDVGAALTSPPTRPAPTVPRPSFTGLRDSDDQDQYIIAKMARTGPESALFGSSGFAEELLTGEWQNMYKVPKRGDEKILPPQLLSKILANLFHWMQHGNFHTMQAKTLMDYLHHISRKDMDGRLKPAEDIFGGRSQQDAQEFLSFLITELDDETNTLRDRNPNIHQPKMDVGKSVLQGAVEYWREHRQSHASLVDKYWRTIELLTTTCKNCGHSNHKFEVSDFLALTLPPDTSRLTLDSLLEDYTAPELISEYKCDSCKVPGTNINRRSFARLPDLLCILFRRFTHMGGENAEKDNRIVTFPVRDFDMTPYFLPDQKQPAFGDDVDTHFQGPFIYDAYAVVTHGGSLKSGHYQAYVRDEGSNDPTLWNHFNDTIVTEVHIGTGRNDAGLRELYAKGDQTAYMAFYKRRDTRR